MLVPLCTKCGNRNLILAPRERLEETIQVYCAECHTYYYMGENPRLGHPGTLVAWNDL